MEHLRSLLRFNLACTGIMDGISINMVDYYKISIDPNYITTMTQLETANITGLNFSQYYAFWINAYNFAVVRTVRPILLCHMHAILSH